MPGHGRFASARPARGEARGPGRNPRDSELTTALPPLTTASNDNSPRPPRKLTTVRPPAGKTHHGAWTNSPRLLTVPKPATGAGSPLLTTAAAGPPRAWVPSVLGPGRTLRNAASVILGGRLHSPTAQLDATVAQRQRCWPDRRRPRCAMAAGLVRNRAPGCVVLASVAPSVDCAALHESLRGGAHVRRRGRHEGVGPVRSPSWLLRSVTWWRSQEGSGGLRGCFLVGVAAGGRFDQAVRALRARLLLSSAATALR